MSKTKKRRDRDYQRNRAYIYEHVERGQPKRERRWYECQRKIPYAKRADAEAVVERLRAQGDGAMAVYKCRGHWHVGHLPVRKIATIDRYHAQAEQIAWAVEQFHKAREAQAAALGRAYEEDDRGDITA